MLMPSIYGENLFDNWMDFPFGKDWEKEFMGRKNPIYGSQSVNIMNTDVKEVADGYELDIDLPGFKKEDVKVSLENGYLNISAVSSINRDEQEKDGKYIRRERYSGQCSRSFYLGDGYKKEDITAKFEDGILKMYVPKKDVKKVEQDNYIAIEG